jgi:hypothetical protein
MHREILTYPIELKEVRAELHHLVEYLVSGGFSSCEVQFGGGWGIYYYPTDDWSYVTFSLDSVLNEIERVEALGYGILGRDELYIRVPGVPLEFHFCGDSDIHVSLDAAHQISESLYQRWKSLGYRPAEWVTATKDSPPERVRFE